MDINENASMSFEGIFVSGTVDTSYSSSIKVNTRANKISYCIELGSLPVGLYLNQKGNTITLEGIPTKAGTYAFILRVSDTTEYSDKLFRVTIMNKKESSIDENIALYGTFDNCELRTTYLTYYRPNRIILSGQHRPYTPSLIRGELPSGMSVVRYGYSVCLVGTPNKVGKYTFTLRFTGIGNHYNEEEFSINVLDNRKPPHPNSNMIISSSFGDRCYGSYSSAFVNIYGGYTPYTVELTNGSLPTGLSLRVTGNYIYLEGIPTQNGIFNFTLRVTDKNNGYVEKDFSVTVGDTFDYSMYINSVFRDTQVGEKYSEFVYTRGKSATYTPIITKGELPNGLVLRQSMIRTYLEGSPMKAGTYNFTLRVIGNNQRYTEKNFTIIVS